MDNVTILGEILFAATIIMIWSVLYKDNPFYKFVSSMSVGLMLAFWLKGGLESIAKDIVTPAIFEGNLARFAILILGLLIFLRFYKSVAFISWWPIAILAGVGTAIAAKGAIPAMIFSQISAGTFAGPNIMDNINNFIVWLGLIATLVYFIFSFKRGPIVGGISRIGQVFMMVSFGVIFGQFVYGGSVMVQMLYLLRYPGYYVTILAVLIIVVEIMRNRLKS